MKLIGLMKNFQVKYPRKFQNIPEKLCSLKPLALEGIINWAPVLMDVVRESSSIRGQNQAAKLLRYKGGLSVGNESKARFPRYK